MLRVKKWGLGFLGVAILFSGLLTVLLSPPPVQALGETYEWNKTPAGYPEIRMRGMDLLVTPGGSFVTLRPSPNPQVYSARLLSDLQTVASQGTIAYNCTFRFAIDINANGRMDRGQVMVKVETPDCRTGDRFTAFKAEMSGFFGGGNSFDSVGELEGRKININIANAKAISKEFEDLEEKCKKEANNQNRGEAFEKCMNEGASALNADGKDQEPTCVGGALGWFLCPISEAASASMSVLGNMIQGLLRVQPLDIASPGRGGSTGDSIYTIWNSMRNLANIVFIIFFLVVIFSYITSVGISNYGIKRVLPRLIIAAIMVNLSYFFAALLIDLFNVIGASIEGLFQNGINAAVQNAPGEVRSSIGQGAAVGAVAATLLVIVLKVAGPSILLLLLAPLLSAFIALLTLAAILIARQFLITMLVIFSPFIAVAWLLPGTEKFFSKGVNAGIGALASYPVVMAIIMGSELLVAFMTVTGVAPSISGPVGGGPTGALTAIGILLMQVLVVVVVMTTVRRGMAILNRFGALGGGMVSKGRGAVRGMVAAARANSNFAQRRKEGAGYRAARAEARYSRAKTRTLKGEGWLAGRAIRTATVARGRARRQLRNTAGFQEDKHGAQAAATEYLAEQARSQVKRAAQNSDAPALSRAQAASLQAAEKLEAEELAVAHAAFKVMPQLDYAKIASGKEEGFRSDTYRLAALQKGLEIGDTGTVKAALENAHTLSAESRQRMVAELEGKHGAYRKMLPGTADGEVRQRILGGESLIETNQNGSVIKDHLLEGTKNVIASGKVSAETLASLDGNGRAHFTEALDSMAREVQAPGVNMVEHRERVANLQAENEGGTLEALQKAYKEDQSGRATMNAADKARLKEYNKSLRLVNFESSHDASIDRAEAALNNSTIMANAKDENIRALRNLRNRSRLNPPVEPPPPPPPPPPTPEQNREAGYL